MTTILVAWLGNTLFDHEPTLVELPSEQAKPFIATLVDVVWLVRQELHENEPWPPPVGCYPDDEGLWPWERLHLEDFRRG